MLQENDPREARFSPSPRSAVDAFIAVDIFAEANALAAAGKDIIRMEVGQPSTPAPQAVIEAAKRALDTNTIGYSNACGMPQLRERIARHYAGTYGVEVHPRRVIVTTGSSAGFVLAFLAAFEAGGRIGLPQPGYPCYLQIARALHLTPVFLPTGPENRWMPEVADILDAAASGLDGVLLASPANPTGTMLEPERLTAIAGACAGLGIPFISDEIYHGLHYGVPVITALSCNSDAIIINSFSKYFSMTGWRIGWMIVPERFVRTFERLQQNFFICPPTLSQFAALAALDTREDLETYKRTYAANRDILLNALPEAGFGTFAPPDGAFYIYADVSMVTQNSHEFAARMLAETGVAVTPGIDFDKTGGHRFIRFSYACGTDGVIEAVRRLKAWRM